MTGSIVSTPEQTTKALILIPTYNEVDNIAVITKRIMDVDTSHLNVQLDIFVMDDESPDGTLDLVKKLEKEQYPGRIFWRSGKKKGLGAAMFKSFGHFDRDFDHDILITMDADLSHQPEEIPALLAPIVNDNIEVSVGSRYVHGGLIPGDWSLFFFARTKIATYVARKLGGISDEVHELTTNFRAMTRNVIANMPYDSFDAKGYGFQLQLINYLTSNGYKVREVPISFHSRIEGEPKGKASDVFEFFKIAYQLDQDSPFKQLIRFASIGLSGIIVNLAVLYQLSVLFPDTAKVYLAVIAIQVSIITNFILHTVYTFKERTMHDDDASNLFSTKTAVAFVKYDASSALVQILTLTIFTTLTQAGIYFLLAQFIGIISAFVLNYYVATRFIWAKRRRANANLQATTTAPDAA